MNKMLNYLGFVAVMIFMTACWSVTTTLDADLFEKTLNQTPNAQLIDVRTPLEYVEGHLQGAVLINIRDANFDTQIQQLDRERPVFVYCRLGRRSLEAAKILEQNKFKVVYNLDGGIIAWREKGKPVKTE